MRHPERGANTKVQEALAYNSVLYSENLPHTYNHSGAIWGGSRVAMATPDQAVATPEIFGPMRRGGQEFIYILEVNVIFNCWY